MRLLYSLLLLLTLSCGDDRFPKVETLDSFRIVAIRATNPEVTPGAGRTSTLSLFVSDPNGAGREIIGTYEACIDPGISLGAEVNCDHDPNKESESYTIDTRVPDLANNLYSGYSGTATVKIPATIHTGRSARDRFNGVAYIAIFRFTVDGQNVTSFKRIGVTDRGGVNANPSGAVINLNGAVISRIPGKDEVLSVTNLIPETYSFINVDGSTEVRSEKLEVSWYISGGKVDKPKSLYGESVKYLESAPASLLLLAVIRDDRGGVEVVRRFQ